MPRRRAVIHIGTAKTGSTTIQRMLAANRGVLRHSGIFVPVSPGDRNHFRLAIYAGRERADRMARATNEAGDAAYVADRFAAEFATEMRAMPASIHTVLFSNEHCYRKLDTPVAVQRLHDLLAPWFDEMEVLVYLRRQDEMAVSLYSTRLRSGADRTEVLPDLVALPNQAGKLDWFALVERWAGVFGRAAMRPRIFARDAFVGGDLLTDYVTSAGIAGVPSLERAESRNGSILPAAQEFLRRVNTALYDGADDEEKAPPFVRAFVDQQFAGGGRRPSRAQAEAFAGFFRASNERLREAWFPERAALFGDDFSRYPEAPDPLPSDTEVLDVAIALVAHQAGERPQLDAEAFFLRAVKLRAAKELAEARAMLHRALGKRSGHTAALRLLFDLATTPTLRREAEARLRRARRDEPERDDLARLQAEQGVVFDPTPITVRKKPRRRATPVEAAAGAGGSAAARANADVPAGATGPGEEPVDPAREERRRRRREQRREARAGTVKQPVAHAAEP